MYINARLKLRRITHVHTTSVVTVVIKGGVSIIDGKTLVAVSVIGPVIVVTVLSFLF